MTIAVDLGHKTLKQTSTGSTLEDPSDITEKMLTGMKSTQTTIKILRLNFHGRSLIRLEQFDQNLEQGWQNAGK